MKSAIIALFALLLLPNAYAQYPTAIGTRWDYFQFWDDISHPLAIRGAFSDEVVSDTLVLGQTYQVVQRTGTYYSGYYLSYNYDTVDTRYYYRVDSTTVWILDSADGTQAYESLLYEFGLNIGDTLHDIARNLINLSPQSSNHYIMKSYNLDTICAIQTFCDTTHIYEEYIPFPGGTLPNSYYWYPQNNNYFLPGIGTIFSHPYWIILDELGQYYHLGTLTSGGVILYKNSFVAAAISDPFDAASMTLFPNPATTQMTIQCEKRIERWEIYDLTGQCIRSDQLDFATETLDIQFPGMAKGLYFLVVSGKDWHTAKRFQVQ